MSLSVSFSRSATTHESKRTVNAWSRGQSRSSTSTPSRTAPLLRFWDFPAPLRTDANLGHWCVPCGV